MFILLLNVPVLVVPDVVPDVEHVEGPPAEQVLQQDQRLLEPLGNQNKVQLLTQLLCVIWARNTN